MGQTRQAFFHPTQHGRQQQIFAASTLEVGAHSAPAPATAVVSAALHLPIPSPIHAHAQGADETQRCQQVTTTWMPTESALSATQNRLCSAPTQLVSSNQPTSCEVPAHGGALVAFRQSRATVGRQQRAQPAGQGCAGQGCAGLWCTAVHGYGAGLCRAKVQGCAGLRYRTRAWHLGTAAMC